jgi:hypothetical protein
LWGGFKSFGKKFPPPPEAKLNGKFRGSGGLEYRNFPSTFCLVKANRCMTTY